MRIRIAAAVTALSALTSPMLAAQTAGTIEVGAFGRFTRFDRSLGLDNALGGGGWLGVFVAPGLAIEGAGSYLATAGPLTPNGSLYPLHARLVYARPVAGSFA